MHQSGVIPEAVLCYTAALEVGNHSSNLMRLQCLEAIELVIKEKAQLEKRQIETVKISSIRQQRLSSDLAGWNQCRQIYQHLSHHYILRRSVVFVVDTEFDSVVCRDIAMKHVRSFYNGLDG